MSTSIPIRRCRTAPSHDCIYLWFIRTCDAGPMAWSKAGERVFMDYYTMSFAGLTLAFLPLFSVDMPSNSVRWLSPSGLQVHGFHPGSSSGPLDSWNWVKFATKSSTSSPAGAKILVGPSPNVRHISLCSLLRLFFSLPPDHYRLLDIQPPTSMTIPVGLRELAPRYHHILWLIHMVRCGIYSMLHIPQTQVVFISRYLGSCGLTWRFMYVSYE